MQLVQRIQAESFGNYLYFATLTYNNDSLPILEVNGHYIRYADISDLQNCFKRLRKSCAFTRPFRYIAVSELGSARGRPHFHCIFLIPKYDSDDDNTPFTLEKIMFDALLFEWRRNYGSRRNPVYRPLCTFVRRFVNGRLSSNYDLHFVVPHSGSDGSSDVSFYVLKYMLKDSTREVRLQQALKLNLDPLDYERIWNTVKSKRLISLRFGLSPDADNNPSPSVIDHVRRSIDMSKLSQDFPCFINPDTGQLFPLSRYYRNKFFTADDMAFFYDKADHSVNIDSPIIPDGDLPTLSDIDYKIHDFNRKVKQSDSNGFFTDDSFKDV